MTPTMPPMQPPVASATTLTVKRTFPVDETGMTPEEAEASQVLETRLFETTPAMVSAQIGQTINLGNYESLKLAVGVSIPCYAEEVNVGLQAASSLVSTFLQDEVTNALDALKAARQKP